MSDYIYAVTRAHTQEANMISRADIERLLAAESVEAVLGVLREKGWDVSLDVDAMLDSERERAWAFIGDMVGDMRPFAIFQLEADYHNLKAALKLAYLGKKFEDAGRYLLPGGTIAPEVLFRAASRHDFSELPEALAQCAQKGYEALLHTQSGQAADAYLDAGALLALDRAGKETPSALLRRYARVRVDGALLRIALRAARMGFSRDYLAMALPEAGSLDRAKLIEAALNGREAVLDFIAGTEYREAAGDIDCWFDDRAMALFLPQKRVFEGLEPLAAYLVARMREIEAVRLILSAKRNNLRREAVAERLRTLYV